MTGSPVSPSGVSSLKAIFSILMGLSVTNTLVVLIKSNGEGSITTFAGLDPLHLVFAGVLLFTIARFYLGNVRHVDDFYVNASVDGVPLDPRATSASRFALDFTVLLIEALLFSLASFYIVHPTNFVEITMALLVLDILWTTSASADAPHSWFWLRNNLVHVLLIAICFGFHLKYETSQLPFYFAVGLLLTNGLIDMVWNRGFYFADRGHERTIFLSAPFTQLMTESGLPAAVERDLNLVIDHFEGEGWLVDNAHKRERWGARLDSPLIAVSADLRGIEKACVLIAILGSPPSPGVQSILFDRINTGCCSALGLSKRTAVLAQSSQTGSSGWTRTGSRAQSAKRIASLWNWRAWRCLSRSKSGNSFPMPLRLILRRRPVGSHGSARLPSPWERHQPLIEAGTECRI